MAFADVMDRTAEPVLFALEGDTRSPEQIAEDSRLAEKLAEVRSVADALGMTTRELATLAMVATATVAPLDLTAKPPTSPTERERHWKFKPSLTFVRTYNRRYVGQDEQEQPEMEHRAARFNTIRFVPHFIKRWIGAEAIFFEFGHIKNRQTDQARRRDRMMHDDVVSEERTLAMREQHQADEEAVLAAREGVVDKAYRPATGPYIRREKAQVAMDGAEAAYHAALGEFNRNASAANEKALVSAREAFHQARNAYSVADGRYSVALAYGYFRATVAVDLYDTRRTEVGERAHRRALARHERPVVAIDYRLFKLY